METVRFFEKLGFEVVYTGKSSSAKEKKTKVINTEKGKMSQQGDFSAEKRKINPAAHKIKISSKKVIEQKNALQLILNRLFNGDVVCEKTFPWLKTPKEISGEYKEVYEALLS